MPYDIQCRNCRFISWAGNIVDLINDHTDPEGRFVCSSCKGNDTYIYRISSLQEKGEVWERWIKGIILIDSGVETYRPYVFLTADSEDGAPTGLHYNYFKDTRSEPEGYLKHGHGPGGAPVLGINDLFFILQRLVATGVIPKSQVKQFADSL